MIARDIKIFKTRTGVTLFDIFCPCGCGRGLPIQNIPYTHDIQELGKIIWQQLVKDKGIDGAIAFLHESVDIG